MKTAAAIMILAAVLITAGCMTTSTGPHEVTTVPTPPVGPGAPAGVPPATLSPYAATAVSTATSAEIPDLTGTWTGTMTSWDEGTGFSDHAGDTISLIVTEQQDRIFAGRILIVQDGTQYDIPVAGAIGRDGRTISIVEKDMGYATGVMVSADEIELTWMHDASPYGVAVDELVRA